MGYSALKAMKDINKARFGIAGPEEPQDIRERNKKSMKELEKYCITFIRDYCEDLRFDPKKNDLTDCDGGSIKKNSIPYNMEMDIDRLCLENAVHRFIISGTAQDAFDIYFCFLEMYLGDYAKAKQMIEMLAEFESNAGSLLMKHRDHYSHSAYVFVLGTAIYASSASYRLDYMAYIGENDEHAAAHSFLRQWGFAALFHDIGYPFELPFEQVKSYFGDTIKDVPYVSYKGIEKYLTLSGEDREHFTKVLDTELPIYREVNIEETDKNDNKTVVGKHTPVNTESDINSVLAAYMANVLGATAGKSFDKEDALDILGIKPGYPNAYGGYMDHAYFSAVLLFRQLCNTLGTKNIGSAELDIFLAILLHNSIYYRTLCDEKYAFPRLSSKTHPLTYMLMLCDELQCWDRISYGRESRSQIHPMWCEFKFDGDNISAVYHYDVRMKERVDKALEKSRFEQNAKSSVDGTYPKMVSADGKHLEFKQGESKSAFIEDIEKRIAVNCEDGIGLDCSVEFSKGVRAVKSFISKSSFLHLYNFAVALNARYFKGDVDKLTEAEMEKDFDDLSLEYKLSNVQQAKAFSKYLDAIGCFYTDTAVTHEMVDAFSDANMDVIGPMEHERWLKEKRSMGWMLDDKYLEVAKQECFEGVAVRELTRTHALMIEDYDELDEAEQNKDTAPMDCMLKLIEKYDGLRIYRV